LRAFFSVRSRREASKLNSLRLNFIGLCVLCAFAVKAHPLVDQPQSLRLCRLSGACEENESPAILTPHLVFNTPDVPLILLAGPTAVGKTELALELAGALQTEIVNADSMQVYRHMEIGTAKPTSEQRAQVPHHLLDVVTPDEPFDAAAYLEQAQPVIEELRRTGRAPLVVGGTGLYLKTLVHGICAAAPGDAAVKRQLLHELEQFGLDHLYRELLRVDPDSAARLHPRDRQRIVRALEVYRISGQPLSAWQAEHGFRHTRYRTLKIFLTRPREELYARINQRVLAMLAQGFLEEVRLLLDQGYSPELKPMQALGYRQLGQHLQGRLSLDQAIQDIKSATRHYAKRQLTWFRADPEYRWYAADHAGTVIADLKRALTAR
jgi:tRNA dimethylallyltransferase